jgi:hypothetical protein
MDMEAVSELDEIPSPEDVAEWNMDEQSTWANAYGEKLCMAFLKRREKALSEDDETVPRSESADEAFDMFNERVVRDMNLVANEEGSLSADALFTGVRAGFKVHIDRMKR